MDEDTGNVKENERGETPGASQVSLTRAGRRMAEAPYARYFLLPLLLPPATKNSRAGHVCHFAQLRTRSDVAASRRAAPRCRRRRRHRHRRHGNRRDTSYRNRASVWYSRPFAFDGRPTRPGDAPPRSPAAFENRQRFAPRRRHVRSRTTYRTPRSRVRNYEREWRECARREKKKSRDCS